MAEYPKTVETGTVHRPDCRYARPGLITWPRYPRRARACRVCLPDGLPTPTDLLRAPETEGDTHG